MRQIVAALIVALLWAAPAQAQLAFVGGTTGTGEASDYTISLTSLTGGSGSAPSANDIVIVVSGWGSAADGDPGVTTTGYTEEYDLYANDTRDANLSVAWKIMGATPDTSVDVSCIGNGNCTAVVHVWSGVDTTTPMDVAVPTGLTGINGARPDSPSITPVTAGAVVITAGLGTGDATPADFTAPSGYGNALSQANPSEFGAIAVIASIAWSGSGAEDPGAWTGGESTTSDSRAAGTLALRPAADGGAAVQIRLPLVGVGP